MSQDTSQLITRDVPHGRLTINPAFDQVTSDWFLPGYWGKRAVPVSSGGRGGAWFIESACGDLVLRHYRRGGLMAKLSEQSYVFTGYDRTRSLAELQLLMTLWQQGLPVPEPVAAYVQKRQLLWYHAAILIRRIPGAVPLPDSERVGDEALWQEVGSMVRRFHDAGLDHVDLNCDNILVADAGVYLIDFDRCRLRGSAQTASDWSQQNLRRLKRSVDKRCGRLPEPLRESLWNACIQAYREPIVAGKNDQANT